MKGLCNLLTEIIDMLKRVMYIPYYFKKLDRVKFNRFFTYVKKNYNYSGLRLWKDILVSALKYNISLLDYFYFRFFELNKIQRKEYAGTGYMYEYQLVMNPKVHRDILENKILFNTQYAQFIKHKFWEKTVVLLSKGKRDEILSTQQKVILKSSNGQCGEGIQLIDITGINQTKFIELLNATGNDLIEEYIEQHDNLMRLSPSGLNTVRIFTQLSKENEVVILGARLRITNDSFVDNLAAGNIAAPIDLDTGKVYGKGVYSDITKEDVEKHPITGVSIVDFQIPYWKETLEMVTKAALLYPENRSVGWDVAVTNTGPELLEGNHNWCKLLWQLPVKKGLKKELENYII